jgi:predicted Rossmann fold nucleotide-binding protein DprA/Smf involved in DNA uptake
VCPARTLLARIRPEWRKPLEEGRLLLLSAFPEKDRRITEVTSLARNRFVAALAEVILFAYAEPGGKTESFCREVLTWGKRVFVLDDPANANLLALGAKAASPQTVLVG